MKRLASNRSRTSSSRSAHVPESHQKVEHKEATANLPEKNWMKDVVVFAIPLAIHVWYMVNVGK